MSTAANSSLLQGARPAHRQNNQRFRLKRWPNFQQLDYQPLQVKAAVLMTKKAQSVDQLCAKSGLELAAMEHFLAQCDSLGYLDTVAQPATPLTPLLSDLPEPARQSQTATRLAGQHSPASRHWWLVAVYSRFHYGRTLNARRATSGPLSNAT